MAAETNLYFESSDGESYISVEPDGSLGIFPPEYEWQMSAENAEKMARAILARRERRTKEAERLPSLGTLHGYASAYEEILRCYALDPETRGIVDAFLQRARRQQSDRWAQLRAERQGGARG